MRRVWRRLGRVLGVMISREAVEVLGFAAVVAGFYEALGLAAALFAAGLSAIFLASFGGRR